MPRSTASATMFAAAPVSSFITTIPPNPMIDRCSPVLPKGRRAIGLLAVAGDAFTWLVDATAAAVIAAFFKNSRRFMVCLQGMECDGQRTAAIFAQIGSGQRPAAPASQLTPATAPGRTQTAPAGPDRKST